MSLIAISFCVVVFVSTSTGTTAAARLPATHDLVYLTLLEETWISEHRVRRGAGSSLPDKLSFSVPVEGVNAVLRMKRSRLLPAVLSGDRSTREISEVMEHAAVYTDLSKMSAMIVKRCAGNYTLKGTFVHSNTEWTLEHVDESKRDGEGDIHGHPHRIFPLLAENTTISYLGDDIVLEEDGLGPDSNSRNPLHGMDKTTHDQQGVPDRGNNHRRKRATTKHVIKIAFIVDFADYQKWVKYVGKKDTPGEMRLWYTYVADSIDIRYKTIKDPELSIRTRVTVLKIINNPADAIFLSNLTTHNGLLDGKTGLAAIVKWFPEQEDIPASDHYMLFTGLEMDGVAGIAYMSRLCTKASVSLIENRFNGFVGNTAAHELAHSLSADHDKDTNTSRSCNYNDQYIMAQRLKTPVSASVEGHPWRFSECSINAFKVYLNSVNCTLESAADKNELPAPVAGERAGEVLSRDDQCRLSYRDSSSYFCQDIQILQQGAMDGLCGGMFCAIPKMDWLCQNIVPQEFTECGQSKWCVTGKCVSVDDDNAIPPTDSTRRSKNTASPFSGRPSAVVPTQIPLWLRNQILNHPVAL